MDQDSDKLSAALTGIAVAAASHVIRANNDTNDRLDSTQADTRALRRELRELKSNGHIVRDTLPHVADLLSGIALATQESPQATLLPNLSTVSRPSLISMLTSAVTNFQWPPKPGSYTSNGYIEAAGELTSLGLIFTFEEVRAFLHGLVGSASPDGPAKLQTFYSAQGLAQAIISKSYSATQWIAIWKSVLSGGGQPGTPMLTVLSGPHTASFLTGARVNAMNVKFTVTGAINAGTPLAKVAFPPMVNVPAVVVSSGVFQIDNVTGSEFTITNRVGLNNGDTPTAAILLGSCDAT